MRFGNVVEMVIYGRLIEFMLKEVKWMWEGVKIDLCIWGILVKENICIGNGLYLYRKESLVEGVV